MLFWKRTPQGKVVELMSEFTGLVGELEDAINECHQEAEAIQARMDALFERRDSLLSSAASASSFRLNLRKLLGEV